MTVPGTQSGLIVANHGRHCVVENASGERRICHARGKKSQGVVGDRVLWLASLDEGTIEKIEPRRNLFYRQDDVRTKSFAANIDRLLILLAAEPEFSGQQLARALIAAEAQGLPALIVLNKRDLASPYERAWRSLAPYRQMGYEMLGTSLASDSPADLASWTGKLQGQATLVLGPSGSGKSTLINRLLPGARVQTAAVSQALKSGRHTTTCTTWYWLDAAKTTAVLDSPGFQEFGLHHIDPAQLAAYMPDLRPHVADCRFYNCSHLHEPGCGVIASVQSDASPGGISVERYKIYGDLYTELSQAWGLRR